MDSRLTFLVAFRIVTFFAAIFLVANVIFLQFFVVYDASAAMLPPVMGDPGLREAIIDDLALDGSLIDQYTNFMTKVLSGEFFMSVSVHKYAPTSEFVYSSSLITASQVLAVLVVASIAAVLYACLAYMWAGRLKGKAMLSLALVAAVSFVVPVLLYVELLLFEMDADELVRESYIMTIAIASIPVSATLVLILEGLQRRTGPFNISKPYESIITLARGESFRAIIPIFLVYAVTCVLITESFGFTSEGLGRLVYDSFLHRDYQVLIACIYIVAVMLLMLFLFADLVMIFASRSLSRRPSAPEARHVEDANGGKSLSRGTTGPGLPSLLRALRGDGVFVLASATLAILLSIGVLAPLISTVQDPYDYENFEPNVVVDRWFNPLSPSLTPSPYTGLTHPLGTDPAGRDVYSMLLYDSLESTLSALLIATVSIAMGVAVSFLRVITQRIGGPPKEAVGWLGWLISDVLLAIPLFLAVSTIIITRTSDLLIFVSLAFFIFASFGKGVAANLLLSPHRSNGYGSVLRAPSVSEVFHIGKYCFLFCFFSIAFVGLVFHFMEWMNIGWVGIIESAFHFGAFYRGMWWLIIPPMIMLGLLAASLFTVMDRVERILHKWSVESETGAEQTAAE